MATALLFDMDGLLLDTEKVALMAFLDVAEAFDLADAEQFFLALVGSSSAQTRMRLEMELGHRADPEAFQKRWSLAFNAHLANEVPVKPGVRDVVQSLGARGETLVVVTSTATETARDHLGRAGLLHHFRDVVGGDRVSAHKPDPAPYLLGAEIAGVAPHECAAFEDSDPGVAAAVAAGCRVSQIPDLRPAGKPLPNLGQGVFDTLGDAVAAAGFR